MEEPSAESDEIEVADEPEAAEEVPHARFEAVDAP